MGLPLQIIPCGAQSLGGGYTAVNSLWTYRGVRPGRTYRVTLLGAVGGTDMGVSYNGNACNLSCDAWHAVPQHDFLAPAGAITTLPVGRANPAPTTFTDYQIQDLGPDEAVALANIAHQASASQTLAFPAAAAGRLLVLNVYVNAAPPGTFPQIGVPAGWIAAGPQQQNWLVGGRSFYRIATGGENSVTVPVSGSPWGATDQIAVREYSGLGASALLTGIYQTVQQIQFAWALAPPPGTLFAAIGVGMNDATGRYVQDAAGVANPFVNEYISPDGSAERMLLSHLVSPAAQAGSLQPAGAGTYGAMEVLYFAPGAAFAGEPGGGVW